MTTLTTPDNEMEASPNTNTNTTNNNNNSGVAGRINYRQWDQVTSDLVDSLEHEESKEKEEAAAALGLDGKYARSQAEADERSKSQDAKRTKQMLERYQQREGAVLQRLEGLLGDFRDETKDDDEAITLSSNTQETKSPTIVRVTRDTLEAGKRVVTLAQTSGSDSQKDKIVLTQDLSHLESKMAPNAKAKDYEENAENQVAPATPSVVHGLIKVFLSHLSHCTVVVRCKIISGTIEMNHCHNVIVRIEKEATVTTLQVDLCRNVQVHFCDAPSGQNNPRAGNTLYWGDDKNDRVFSAGVSNLQIFIERDGFVELQRTVDYVKDGAVAVGNATPEECQFVTSVMDEELVTEQVVRHGATTGRVARPMTQRELDEEQKKRDQAVDMAMEKAIRFQEKHPPQQQATVVTEEEEDVEEVYTSMSKSEIDAIVADCEIHKQKGNEAFGAGEYAQAVLLYSLALDKADELPDQKEAKKALFARHVVLSNRSASFLKLGEHEKALADATRAQELDPTYVKAIFRRGLALHAMGRYQEAIPVLGEAHKIEPKNKQIKQALQFAEVRMTQEMRKRMEQG